MKNINLGLVIVVTLVVAVVASLITTNMTGNVIKQTNNPYGQYKVYTTAEVDKR